MVSIIVEMMRF